VVADGFEGAPDRQGCSLRDGAEFPDHQDLLFPERFDHGLSDLVVSWHAPAAIEYGD
jgi:hypothetical protein